MTGPAIVTSSASISSRWSIQLSPAIGACVVFITCLLFLSVFGSMVAPIDPSQQDLAVRLASPSRSHWLGTDALGRDVLSRVFAGSRSAFLGPLVIATGSLILGNALGLWAGYRGGRVDSVLMRGVDLMWAIPGLLVVIVVAGAFGGGYWFAVALLVVLFAPFDARVVRGATLEQVPLPYVEAAKTLGVSDRRIMFVHIWPNVSSIAVANSFLGFARALITLAGLSFLGFGVAPGTPDWGLMVAEGRQHLFSNPVAALGPAGMIVLTAATVNLLGDWLYERLSARGAVR